MAKIIQIRGTPAAPKTTARPKSQYEKYPLPFFDRARHSVWAVKPTGNYGDDCETGKRYATEFLRSCDGTVGWSTLLPQIVVDMIGAGQTDTWPDGHTRANGVVVGFLSTIGKALTMLAAKVAKTESEKIPFIR